MRVPTLLADKASKVFLLPSNFFLFVAFQEFAVLQSPIRPF